MMKKEKVLLIFSRIDKPNFQFNIEIISYAKSIKNICFDFVCVVDPTRKELELILQKDKYICIIPFAQYTLVKENTLKYEINDYVISQLLQNLKLEFFGNSYISTLVLNDKSIYAEMSMGAPEPCLITRYNYLSQVDILGQLNFPVTLEPSYAKNYISSVLYQANSLSDTFAIISRVFEDDLDIDEIYLHKNIDISNEFIVTIIGNPPFSIDIICEYNSIFPNGNAIKNTEQHNELITNSYKLFREYNFKDFGQFKYVYNDTYQKYYLVDVNSSNSLNNTIIDAFQKYYDADINDILNILLIVCLTKQTQETKTLELIKYASENLPNDISEKIIPFVIRKQIYSSYSYKNVCNELKVRLLQGDERNRYDFIKHINNALYCIPIIKNANDVFLGKPDKSYSFLGEYETIPQELQDPQKTLDISTKILSGQMRWHAPTMLYNVNPPVMFNTVAATTITKLYNPNAITRRTSAGLTIMEDQIIRQLAKLLNWNEKNASGIFTPGGKYCITYAIKCGLNRCDFQTQEPPVVITSEINHFSIESVCNHLGLSGQCRRVPVTLDGTIDFNRFKEILLECFTKKIPIACIIFSGGNTTHCNVEDINKGVKILKELIFQLHINYKPYIYYDLVIGWPWLFFKYYDFEQNRLEINIDVLDKIKITLEKCKHSDLADGVGIDFHKGGFAPYTNSIFLSQNPVDLYSVSGEYMSDSSREPYYYSFGNSRETSDILVTWNVLQSVGIEGFQSYIVNMLTIANIFTKILPNYGFTILEKDNTYGFATIIWATNPKKELCYDNFIKESESIIFNNNEYLYALSEYWISNPNRSYYTRFLPNYKTLQNNRQISIIALLPMSLNIDDKQAEIIANDLGNLKKQFDQKYMLGINPSFGKMPEIVEK